jgi:hypothetical protein
MIIDTNDIKNIFDFDFDVNIPIKSWLKDSRKKQMIIIILIFILLWRVFQNNMILLGAIGYLLLINDELEDFDQTGTVFADTGEDKYDLAGQRMWYTPPSNNEGPNSREA